MARRTLQPAFTITNAITAGLAKIERARGFLEAAPLSEEWVYAMGERALLLEAHHTTHIEGTQLTLDQAKRLMGGQPVPEADPDDVCELLNYRRAFEFVSEYLDSGAPITEGLIRDIHKHLVEGVRGGTAAPGQYRKVQNYVANIATGQILYTPPPAYEVSLLMAEMVAWINAPGEMHPVLASGVAQFELVHIHPFMDGNGRASRLLSTLCLYRSGYDFKKLFAISEYYDRDRPAFYKAIQGVRDCGMDMTGWLEYFVDGLAAQLNEVTQRGKQAIEADTISRRHALNERQAAVLRYAIGQGEIRIQDMEALCSGVHRRTLQRDIKRLVDEGLLVELGTGPTDPDRRYAWVAKK